MGHRIRRISVTVLLGVILVFGAGVSSAQACVIADSYPESNWNFTYWPMFAGNLETQEIGQSFTAVGGTLDSAMFCLSKGGSPTGTVQALIYAHSGTYGSTSMPLGAPLAVSAPIDVAAVPEYDMTPHLVTFRFDNTLRLTAGEHYVIACGYDGGDLANHLRPGCDVEAPTHAGNAFSRGVGFEGPHSDIDAIFYLYEEPPMPVYRFYNARMGTHFYSADEAETQNVRANLSGVYTYEGVGYTLLRGLNTAPLHRFYNRLTGTHFYTADATEKARVEATMAHVYTYEGVAYNVSPDSGGGTRSTVYRFYNVRTGTHFYTADPSERDSVAANLGHIYHYEGPAFFLGQ